MFIISTLLVVAALSNAQPPVKYDIFMPKVVPEQNEAYMCTTVRLNRTSFYIVGFEPKASKRSVHHMLLYGCKIPGSLRAVWDCGKMDTDSDESGSPCTDGNQVIYAWGLDAPPLTLPKDVGFKVGGDSPVRYLVLQVHYAHKFRRGAATDRSGVRLHYRERKVPKTAGVLILGTGGELKPYSEVNMETACVIEEDKELHPFAFRTHTHKLGKSVSGWKVTNKAGQCEWELIGERNPQEPQTFYTVENHVVIRKGDIVAARCSMYNFRNKTVFIGARSYEEMCNFYIMYWTSGDESLRQKYCFSNGPPEYFWNTGPPYLNNIPGKEATNRELQVGIAKVTKEQTSRSMAISQTGSIGSKFQRNLWSLGLSFGFFQGAILM